MATTADILSLSFVSDNGDATSPPSLSFSLTLSSSFSNVRSLQVLFWPVNEAQTFVTLSRNDANHPFVADIALSSFARSGPYNIRAIDVIDNTGTQLRVTEQDLIDRGLPHSITLSNPNADNEDPVLQSLIFGTPSTATDGSIHISVSLSAADNLSGLLLSRFDIFVVSPTGLPTDVVKSFDSSGHATVDLRFDSFSPSGIYAIQSVRLVDLAGNFSYSENWLETHPSTISIINPNGDAVAPSLKQFALGAAFDPLTDRPKITINGLAIDEQSGLERVFVRFLSPPPSNAFHDIYAFFHQPGSAEKSNAVNLNASLPLTTDFLPGEYSVSYVETADLAGNFVRLFNSDLALLHLANSVKIFFPVSPIVGGTGIVDGTESDDFVFGSDRQNDRLNGSGGRDYLYSGKGTDILDGGPGPDRMEGGTGADTYIVDDAGDDVFETDNLPSGSSGLKLEIDLGSTIDTVIASVSFALSNYIENLTLASGTAAIVGTGNVLDNALVGNEGANVLNALGGADTLTGGAGNDSLDGGAGMDTATFNGNRLGFTITQSSAGYIVTDNNFADGNEGADMLKGIEHLAFADLTMNLGINNPPIGSVTVSGTATQGQALAAANTLSDVDGLGVVTYVWTADGVVIQGERANTVVLTQAQVGKSIIVTASYTDLLGSAESVTSIPTLAVVNGNDAPVAAIYRNQVASLGQPVTLNLASLFTDSDGDALSFDANGLPVGLSFGRSTGQITGTAPSATGLHHIVVTGTDGGGLSANLAFDLTITDGHVLTANVITRTGAALSGVTAYELVDGVHSGGNFDMGISGQYSGILTATNPGLSMARGISDLVVNGSKPVTAADALDALKLSVGLSASKGSSWKEFISADINHSGSVTAADALEILRASVGINTIQPSWVFVPTDNGMNLNLDAMTRTTVTYNDKLSLLSITASTSTSFTGILVGDVNNSWVIPA